LNTRRFKLHTHLILPLDLLAGPGAAHNRCRPGDVIEPDAQSCRRHDRFLRGRIRAGDLTELEVAPVAATAHAAPSAPAPVKA